MEANDEVIDPLKDICVELDKVVTNQASRLSLQDTAISNIIDRISDLMLMMKELQASLGVQGGLDSAGLTTGNSASRSIRPDLLKFQGVDLPSRRILHLPWHHRRLPHLDCRFPHDQRGSQLDEGIATQ